MTNNTLTLRSFDIPGIHKFAVGFDGIFDELLRVSAQQGSQNYPPYNIVKQDENRFVIELAVAGFREGDINVTVEQNMLVITGDKIETIAELDRPQPEYIHRGISQRSFTRTFTLADHVEVIDASAVNGILSVTLERKIPEELKAKRIDIKYNK